MDDTITCLVRGPGSRYPSGFMWLFPAWFVILSGAALLVGQRASGHIPLWLSVTEVGGILVACTTAACVLLTARRSAFRADQRGILLGSRKVRKRTMKRVYLPWSEIAQVCLVPRRYGILVEIVLAPYSAPPPRPSLGRQAGRLLGALVMPLWASRGRPALTMPRQGPLRYRLQIVDMPAGQLRMLLHQVAPRTVPVRLFNNVPAMRVLSPHRAPPAPPRPSWPSEPLGSAPSTPVGSAPAAPLDPTPAAPPPVASS